MPLVTRVTEPERVNGWEQMHLHYWCGKGAGKTSLYREQAILNLWLLNSIIIFYSENKWWSYILPWHLLEWRLRLSAISTKSLTLTPFLQGDLCLKQDDITLLCYIMVKTTGCGFKGLGWNLNFSIWMTHRQARKGSFVPRFPHAAKL